MAYLDKLRFLLRTFERRKSSSRQTKIRIVKVEEGHAESKFPRQEVRAARNFEPCGTSTGTALCGVSGNGGQDQKRSKKNLRTFAPKSSHAQIFLNLPRRKVIIYFCQRGKKQIGGHRLCFGENMPRKIP